MKKTVGLALVVCFLAATATLADVTLVERHAVGKLISKPKGPHPTRATGSLQLVDAGGLKYFINTNITFSTSSSASAGMSEANFTHAVPATTSAGGTTPSSLNDMFDGYNTICLSLNNTVATCETGNANFVIYNKNGAAPTPDTTCEDLSGLPRQYTFPVQTSGSIQMQRKVFVPKNDEFARWLNSFKNTSTSPQTMTMVVANNLGSDANTIVTGSSNGSGSPITNPAVTWVASFQNYSGNTSSDPRIGHVFWGPGAAVPMTGINFVNGDDNPFWGYTFTLNPGETKIIMNFVTGQPSKAAAAAQAAALVGLPPSAVQCMTAAERAQVANFAAAVVPIVEVPTLGSAGLAGLVALLLGAATIVLLRRRS